MTDRYEENYDELAHEIWAVAQLAPGEGIMDGAARVEALLRKSAHPAITHCDNCGCDWLDNGVNPVGCPYCKQSDDAKILVAERDKLEAEIERLTRYYKNGIDCFANPCERHSGERTPPFSEFFEKYGGRCVICLVDSNKALQAKNERLREALKEADHAMRFAYTSCATFPQEPQHIQNAAWRLIVSAVTQARAVLTEENKENGQEEAQDEENKA